MNQADTAWMLISTALVLLMTPALAFFYGGLVRSKNALNTMMMSFISLGFVGRALGADRLLAGADARQQLDRRPVARVPERRRPEPNRRHRAAHDSARALHGVPGHVLHHHGGADLRRHRRAHAASRPICCSSASGRWSSTRRWRTGCGAAAGWPTWARWDFAGGTVVHVNAGVAALVAAIVVGKRSDYGHAVDPAAQRPDRPARRRPALVRLVRLQRRQRPGRQPDRRPGVRDDDAGAGGDAGGLDVPRHDALGQADGGGLRHGDRRRPGGDHAGRRLHQPDERACCSARSPQCRATSA